MTDMITQRQAIVERKPWQTALQQLITGVDELLEILQIDTRAIANPDRLRGFPLRVTRSFVSRMRPGDLNDPLLKQVFPHSDEDIEHPDYQFDPLNEQAYNTQRGLIHKYHGRVLLTLSSTCAIHCRYCFRRHFPYQANLPNPAELTSLLESIASDASLHEVILSGGDPLLLPDNRLAYVLNALAQIDHVKTIRIHTRIPIVLPERLDDDLCRLLAECPTRIVMVIHCNHANEIDSSVGQRLAALHQGNIVLLNQAVLLRGINDSPAALVQLSRRLFEHHVMPYYLHLMDKVAYAAHYTVEKPQAVALMHEVASQLPGYLVPKLCQEVAGEKYKKIIAY